MTGKPDDKDNKGAKEPFDKATDEVPLWVQLGLMMQLILARILTQPEDDPAPAQPKALVRAEQADPVKQLKSGTFRFYSPAELSRLLEITYQLKDVVQTNCVAMRGLEDATVKDDSPEAVELCDRMNELGARKRIDSENALGLYVTWAAQIQSYRKSAGTLYEPRPHEEKFPVVDCERQLVVDIADSMSRAYRNMVYIQQNIENAAPLLDIPQLDRVLKEWEKHLGKYDVLVAEITQFVIGSLGQLPPAPAAAPTPPKVA